MAEKYIEELRSLIEAGLSEHSSHPGDSGIAGRRPASLLRGLILHLHCAEFIHHKGLAVPSDTFLLKDDRSLAGRLYQYGYHDHGYRKDDKGKDSPHNIHHSLERSV